MSDVERETRGPCALCGCQVYTDEARERHPDGVRYVHVTCPPGANYLEQASALAEAERKREEEATSLKAANARNKRLQFMAAEQVKKKPQELQYNSALHKLERIPAEEQGVAALVQWPRERAGFRPLSIGSSPLTITSVFEPSDKHEMALRQGLVLADDVEAGSCVGSGLVFAPDPSSHVSLYASG